MTTATAAALAALAGVELPAGLCATDVMVWMQAEDELQAAKVRELELRQFLLAKAFPGQQPGTTNLALGAGYTLTTVLRLAYRLDEPKTRVALEKLRATGEVGALIADRLVKWEPKLSISEHKQLTPKQSALFRNALTITLPQASLEVKPPRG